jgi:YVTN family beta-propeller protein
MQLKHTQVSILRWKQSIRCIGIALLSSLLLHAAPLAAITNLATIPVGKNPGPIAVNPSAHLAYVVNRADNTVSIIDTQALVVKKVVKVGTGPVAIAANPPANLVYVASSGGTITGIQGTAVVGTEHIGGNPNAVVVDSTLNQVYVSDASLNEVKIFNATKGTLLATLSTTLQPTAMAVNIATHAVFVACTGSSTGSVVVIDGTQNQIVTTVSGSSVPAGITSLSVDPVTNVVMMVSPTASSTIAVSIIQVANGYTVVNESGDAGEFPISTAYDPGGLFFDVDSGDGSVYFSDGSGLILFGDAYETYEIKNSAVTANASTNQIGVLNSPADLLHLIDLTNFIDTIYLHEENTGTDPTGLVFDTLASRVFVTNAGDNTVSAFDISPRSVVAAYEQDFNGSDLSYDYVDANPATGTIYTQRLNYLFAVNEAQAAAGATGMSQNTAGVTAIPLASIYSECLAVNAATNKIYVGDGPGNFYSVDGATNAATIVSSVPTSSSIRSIAIDSATNQILAWDYSGDNVFILDGSSEALLFTIKVGSSNPGYLFVDSTVDLAYAVLDSVYVINPATGTIVTTIPLPGSTLYAAFNQATKRLYVVAGQNVAVINTSQNSVITTIPIVQAEATALGVNPVNGNFYLGLEEAGVYHVQVYNGSTNGLITDLSGSVYPEITGASDIKVNPLTNTVYVGSDNGNSTATVAAIDGYVNVVSAVAPSQWETAAAALVVDLGTSVLAGPGYSYTSLWFPTSDPTGVLAIPLTVAVQGIKDSQTIATTPLFRTHNTTPSFEITATSNFSQNATALIPKHAFYQVDGWQGTWTEATLTVKNGTVTSQAKVTTTKLSTGRHVLYVYATTEDVATVQGGPFAQNSPAISPVGSVVFTVEQ